MQTRWLIPFLSLPFFAGLLASAADAPHATLDPKHRAFFKDYCTECHNEKKQKGKLRLDDISFALDSVENADRWQKILNQINSGEMPPEDAKQPERVAKTEFLDSLSHTLMAARRSLGDAGGKITMRRLNRREYKNTIRDLLGVDINVRDLPADGGAGTFDTVGSSLFMSSDQFEQYITLGRQALDEHFARYVTPSGAETNARATTFKSHRESEAVALPKVTKGLAALKADYDRYLKWAAAVDAAAALPENAALAGELRMLPAVKADASLFYMEWAKKRKEPGLQAFGFGNAAVPADARNLKYQYDIRHRDYEDYLAMPHKDTGAYLSYLNGHTEELVQIHAKWPAGVYTVRLRVAAADDAPQERRFIEFGQPGSGGFGGGMIVKSSHQITGTMAAPQILEIPVTVPATGGRDYLIREKKPNNNAGLSAVWWESLKKHGAGPKPVLWIDWIEVESVGTAKAPTITTKVEKLRREPEEFANKQVSNWVSGFKQNYERYQQWTAAVDAAVALPENAALAAELRGLDRVKKHAPYFYSEWMKRKTEPSPTKFGFRDDEDARFAKTSFDQHYRYHADYLAQPHKDTGTYLTIYGVHEMELISAHPKWPAGNYTVRVRIAALDDAPKERRFIEVFQRGQVSTDLTVISSHQVTGTMAQPQILEIPVNVTSTGNREFAIREKQPNSRSAAFDAWKAALDKTGTGPKSALWIDWIEVEGPASKQPAPVAMPTTQPQKLRKDPEQWANKYMPIYAEGYVEKYSRFQKWCSAIDEAAKKPEHAEAVAKLRADPRLKTQPHLFYSGFAKLKGSPSPSQFGFRDVDDAQFARSEYSYHHRYYADYAKLPQRDTGTWLMLYSLGRYTGITAPVNWPAGRYTLRVRIAASDESPKERRFIEIGTGKADAADFNVLSSHQVTGTLANPQLMEIPVEINASGDRNFAIRDKRPNKREAEYAMFREAWDKTGTGPRPCIWVDFVELEGPLNAPAQTSTQSLLIASRQDSAGAREVIGRFAMRAFRDKAPNPDYLDKLVKLFDTRIKAGDKFDVALKTPLSVVLASPRFLYLSEPAEEKKPRPLTAPELATRLSYFLWSAPPDDTLLVLARSGDLMKPEVLTREVDRMIASEKANEFVSGFVHQWLGMERLDFFQFDTKQFRDFDESAKAAARREVYETFAHLLRTNRSARDLLKCDYVIVNGLLATYYGIDGVSGDEFRKVSLPKDSPRGGLLGTAAIMAMGSNGEHSSPVERGVWVLKHLLNNPPPPAPKGVPQITRLNGQPLTTRERLLAHQEQPQCASCHRAIDPIGFGLENFNAAGKWRTEDSFQAVDANGRPAKNGLKTWTIDPAAAFHKGPAFKDYFELRDLIAAKPENFARSITEALIQYALGRPFGFTDEELATGIVQRAQKKDFAMREFLVALVSSKEFHTK